MMRKVNMVKVGNTVRIADGDLYTVVSMQHLKLGKGGGAMQTELKGIVKGTKKNVRWNTEDSIDVVSIDEATYNCFSVDGEYATILNPNTLEEQFVSLELFGQSKKYVEDGIAMTLMTFEEKIIKAKVPKIITCTVENAGASLKNQTVTASLKPALLTNGVTIQVPPFIKDGEKILVNTEDDSYAGRTGSEG